MRYRRELLSFSIPLLSDLTNWMTFARTVILGSGEQGSRKLCQVTTLARCPPHESGLRRGIFGLSFGQARSHGRFQ